MSACPQSSQMPSRETHHNIYIHEAMDGTECKYVATKPHVGPVISICSIQLAKPRAVAWAPPWTSGQ